MLYYALHNIKHYNETEQVRQGRRVRVWFIYCHFLLWRVLHSVDQGEAPRCQLRRPKTLEMNSLAQISWPATAELTFNPVAEREPAKSFRKSSVSSDNDLQRLKDLMPTGFRQVMFREGVVWPEIVGFDERMRFQRAIITPKILYIDFGSKGHAWQSQPRSFHSRVRIPSRSAMCKQCFVERNWIHCCWFLFVWFSFQFSHFFLSISRCFESIVLNALCRGRLGRWQARVIVVPPCPPWGHQVEEQSEISQIRTFNLGNLSIK